MNINVNLTIQSKDNDKIIELLNLINQKQNQMALTIADIKAKRPVRSFIMLFLLL